MLTEIARNIANTQALASEKLLRQLIERLMQDCDLLNAKLRVLLGYADSLRMRERIKHRVVWMNARQSFAFELLVNERHNFAHSLLIVGPIAHNLQAVRQIA